MAGIQRYLRKINEKLHALQNFSGKSPVDPSGLNKFVEEAMEEYFHEQKLDKSERQKQSFDKVRFPKALEWLLENDFRGKKVLEVGGYGLASYVIRKYFSDNEYINTAFDLREKFPYEDNSFDFILNMEVIEHVCDINYQHATTLTGVKQCLKECHRVLKRGGKMFLTTPNANSFWIIQRAMMQQPPMLYDYHFREFTVAEIRDLVAAADFEILLLKTETVWHFWDFSTIKEFMLKQGYSVENRGDDIFLLARK